MLVVSYSSHFKQARIYPAGSPENWRPTNDNQDRDQELFEHCVARELAGDLEKGA